MNLLAEGGEDSFSRELRFERVCGLWLLLTSVVCPWGIEVLEYLGKLLVRLGRGFPAANTLSFA